MNGLARPHWRRILLPVLTLGLFIVLWDVAIRVFQIQSFILAAPGEVLAESLDAVSLLWRHGLVTLQETVVGFAIAMLLAIPIGAAIASSRLVHDALYPLILITQSVPKVAIAPIFLLALGYGIVSKIVIVVLVCFFPIVVNTATGLEATPKEHLLLSQIIRASAWKTFWKIRVPGSLPTIFAGLKLAITLAVIGAVIGEFVGADSGLGYLILISTSNARTALAFGAMSILAVISIGLFYLLVTIESLLVPWKEQSG